MKLAHLALTQAQAPRTLQLALLLNQAAQLAG